MGLLRVEALSGGYHGRPVLYDITFQVSAGEVVTLLGPNGSGKSTLLKLISKTLRPESGKIVVQDVDIEGLDFESLARHLAYVPQEETPAFDFSVEEIVLMGRLAHSSGLFESPEDHRVACDAMSRTECVDLATRPFSELSGGEKQRVLIARALCQEAPLILMDEPTAHLDIRHQMEAAKLVRELALQGNAFVIAVHDLNWASMVADRAILLQQGRIAFQGHIKDTLESKQLRTVYGVEFKVLDWPNSGLRVMPVVESP